MPDVLMPRLSDTMEEGVLSQWVKHEGDQVRRGDVLAVIETDKAAMDMEAFDEGVLTRILVEEGASVPIGTPIAVIGGEGSAEAAAQSPQSVPDDSERTLARPPAPAAQPPVQPDTVQPDTVQPETVQPAARPESAPPDTARPDTARPDTARPDTARPSARPPASPLARKIARERGIDLAAVSGSGPGGRIVRADIEQAARGPAAVQPPAPVAPAPAPVAQVPASVAPVADSALAPGGRPPAPPEKDVVEIPLTRVRQLTAERLAASARDAPHFYLTVVADVGELLAFRSNANQRPGADVKISVTDLLVKACATALAAHPEINVSWDDTRMLGHRHVNIGIAVAIEDGLIVPVVGDADRKTLTEIAREAHDLTTRARARKLTPAELAGGTFTISNLGMHGIRQFTAVINPPQAAILAVGEAVRQPVVRDDQVGIATTMTLTLSIDHRAVDGATGAGFLSHLKQLIEQPLDIVL